MKRYMSKFCIFNNQLKMFITGSCTLGIGYTKCRVTSPVQRTSWRWWATRQSPMAVTRPRVTSSQTLSSMWTMWPN